MENFPHSFTRPSTQTAFLPNLLIMNPSAHNFLHQHRLEGQGTLIPIIFKTVHRQLKNNHIWLVIKSGFFEKNWFFFLFFLTGLYKIKNPKGLFIFYTVVFTNYYDLLSCEITCSVIKVKKMTLLVNNIIFLTYFLLVDDTKIVIRLTFIIWFDFKKEELFFLMRNQCCLSFFYIFAIKLTIIWFLK